MMKIDEMCDLGAHANLIVPPSWVVKLPPKRVSLFSFICFVIYIVVHRCKVYVLWCNFFFFKPV